MTNLFLASTRLVAMVALTCGAAFPVSAHDEIAASPSLALCNATQGTIEATIVLGGSGSGQLLKETLAPGRCSQLSLPSDLSTPLTVSGTDVGGRAFSSLSFQSGGGRQRVRFVDSGCSGRSGFCVTPTSSSRN